MSVTARYHRTCDMDMYDELAGLVEKLTAANDSELGRIVKETINPKIGFAIFRPGKPKTGDRYFSISKDEKNFTAKKDDKLPAIAPDIYLHLEKINLWNDDDGPDDSVSVSLHLFYMEYREEWNKFYLVFCNVCREVLDIVHRNQDKSQMNLHERTGLWSEATGKDREKLPRGWWSELPSADYRKQSKNSQ